jgi:hypothetical protein
MPLPSAAPRSDFEQIVQELHYELNMPMLEYGVLRLAQAEHGHARRVTWIPISFDTQPIEHTSAPRGENGEQAIYSETWIVEAHIIGDDFADAERLRVHIIEVCRRVLGPASEPMGGLWVTQALGSAAHSLGGLEKVVQRFRWKMYMYAPPSAAGQTIVRSVETTVALPPDDPGAQTFTEPSP